MDLSPTLRLSGIVLDCADADTLADFYHRLLGWKKTHSGGGWAGLTAPDGLVLAFQAVPHYIPPAWPWTQGQPGQMLHLDFLAEDLDRAVDHAISCGAVLAGTQFYSSSRTMLDPAGHPFCLDTREPEVIEQHGRL